MRNEEALGTSLREEVGRQVGGGAGGWMGKMGGWSSGDASSSVGGGHANGEKAVSQTRSFPTNPDTAQQHPYRGLRRRV